MCSLFFGKETGKILRPKNFQERIDKIRFMAYNHIKQVGKVGKYDALYKTMLPHGPSVNPGK